MDLEQTRVRGPGFELTKESNLENNLEQLTLAVKIRGETPRHLKTQYPTFDVVQIKGIMNHYLREAKDNKGLSCSKRTTGLREFIHTYVKQTQYASLKTEEQLLLHS